MPCFTFIFAGGGSGGHIAPGMAIAERLREIEPESEALFLCSTRAIDSMMLRDAGEQFIALSATPPSIKPLAAARFMLRFLASKRTAARIMRQRNAAHVVALGGFVAAPVVSAAKACGVPVLLVNLDAPPGKANQWMARRCNDVISAIALPTMPGFASQVVGMPIRRNALAPTGAAGSAAECRTRLGLNPELKTLLITGASQGATSINAFMIAMAQSEPNLFSDWQILHLAGHGADEAVRAGYAAAGVRATVLAFQQAMGLAWGAADLAVSRAGASSVAEAAHNAVPTLFLPYPYHKDMHQKHNAEPFVKLGGAVLAVDQIEPAANVREVGPTLRSLMLDDAQRESMRRRLQAAAPPDAAMTIARMLLAKAGAAAAAGPSPAVHGVDAAGL